MENFRIIKNLVTGIEPDITKFGKGNKAAGTRIRKAMQGLKQLAQEIRREVSEKKNDG